MSEKPQTKQLHNPILCGVQWEDEKTIHICNLDIKHRGRHACRCGSKH